MFKAASDLFGVTRRPKVSVSSPKMQDAQLLEPVMPAKTSLQPPGDDAGEGMAVVPSMVSTMLPRSSTRRWSATSWASKRQLSIGSEFDGDVLEEAQQDDARAEEVVQEAFEDCTEPADLGSAGFFVMPGFCLSSGCEAEDDNTSSFAMAFLRELELAIAGIFTRDAVEPRGRSFGGSCAAKLHVPSTRELPAPVEYCATRGLAAFRRALRGGDAPECHKDVVCDGVCSIEQLPPLAGAAGAALRRSSRSKTP